MKETVKFEWESVRYANDLKTIANMENTNFKDMKNIIDFLAEYNHKEFVKGIISLEIGVSNEEVLNDAYDNYMNDSVMGLIDEKFMAYIDEEVLDENLEINQEKVEGVRFISINDNYDSQSADMNDTHLILLIKNFINDSYCRDISNKVKSVQKVKEKKGDYIGAFAPYGYRKSQWYSLQIYQYL